MKNALLIVGLLLTSLTIHAQEDSPGAIITDRPDATESPNTVGAGFLQFETGAFFTRDVNNGFTTEATTFNTMLIRYGIFDNLELRVGWNFTETQFEINGMELPDVLSGLDPLLLGAKVAITEENGLLPTIGLIGHVFLPFTAGNDYRPETTGADFRFSFAHSLSERSTLSYNLGAQWGDDSPEIAYIYTLSYGYAITDTFGAYLELYGDLPEDSGPNHLWDAGLTYLVNDNFQLDVTVGSGIRSDQELLLSAGFSYRIDTKGKN